MARSDLAQVGIEAGLGGTNVQACFLRRRNSRERSPLPNSLQASVASEPLLLSNESADLAPAPSRVPMGRRRTWGAGDESTSFLLDPKSIIRRRSVEQQILSPPGSRIGSLNSAKLDTLCTSVISNASTQDSQSPPEEQLTLDISYIGSPVPPPTSKTDEILARLNAHTTSDSSSAVRREKGQQICKDEAKNRLRTFDDTAKRLRDRVTHLQSEAEGMMEAGKQDKADKDAGSRKASKRQRDVGGSEDEPAEEDSASGFSDVERDV